MSRRALVTGGSGYFGSLLVARLRESGYSVEVFDVNDADDRPSDVVFHHGDIRDLAGVIRAVSRADVVFHNVAQVPVAKDRTLFREVNVGGMENLLHAAKVGDVGKVVYTSSSAVFGIPERNPVNEKMQPMPAEAYGRAKFEAENLCLKANLQGLDVTIIRPRTILGHGRLGIFSILFDWVADGVDVFVLGSGDNIYQFVHAEDLADACIEASRRTGPATYNIGAAEFGTMRQGLEALVTHAGTGSRVRALPMRPTVAAMRLAGMTGLVPFAPYHWLMYGRSLYFDITKATTELDWRPRFSNAEMLMESYEWFLSNRGVRGRSGDASAHRTPVKQRALGLIKVAIRTLL